MVKPQNLIQEALLDTPGDEFLIGCLLDNSINKNGAIKNNARLLIEIWEFWNSKFELNVFQAALLMLFNCSMRDGMTAMIPVLNGKIEKDLCEKYETYFQKIKKDKQMVSMKGILTLLDFMLGSLMINDPKLEVKNFLKNSSKVKSFLEKTLKSFGDNPEDKKTEDPNLPFEVAMGLNTNEELILNSLIKEIMPLVGSFVEINLNKLTPRSMTALKGIERFLEIFKIILNDKEWPSIMIPAEICFKSIWATKAKKTKDETAKTS